MTLFASLWAVPLVSRILFTFAHVQWWYILCCWKTLWSVCQKAMKSVIKILKAVTKRMAVETKCWREQERTENPCWGVTMAHCKGVGNRSSWWVSRTALLGNWKRKLTRYLAWNCNDFSNLPSIYTFVHSLLQFRVEKRRLLKMMTTKMVSCSWDMYKGLVSGQQLL